MPLLFQFALEDWEQIPIGGKYELYHRPDRPYTIIIDRERNLVALTLEKSSNSNWYAEEFIHILEADETLPLNQQNIYFLEREALISEKKLGITHHHFYSSADVLAEKSYLYTAVFKVKLIEGEGYLGLRCSQEYLLVYNASPYLKYEPTSFEFQKARNIMLSFTGEAVLSVEEIN